MVRKGEGKMGPEKILYLEEIAITRRLATKGHGFRK